MTKVDLYQSLLRKLSHLPATYLEEVDCYLSELNEKAKSRASDIDKIMSFGGSWNDMSDQDLAGLLDDLDPETRPFE